MLLVYEASWLIYACHIQVPQHSELMWILSCTASMGYLSRMTQWKVMQHLKNLTWFYLLTWYVTEQTPPCR
jgi:tryptophanyl-tRNA synthetase